MAVPNTSEALIGAVLDRLRGRFGEELACEEYPDDPDQYRLDHPVGALLVRYHGSKYGQVMDTDVVVQERSLAMEVTLVFRSLAGQDGAYAYLERVRLCLTGFQPPAFGRLRPVNEEFLDQGGGEWRYAIDFATTTTVIQECEELFSPVATQIVMRGDE